MSTPSPDSSAKPEGTSQTHVEDASPVSTTMTQTPTPTPACVPAEVNNENAKPGLDTGNEVVYQALGSPTNGTMGDGMKKVNYYVLRRIRKWIVKGIKRQPSNERL